MKKQCGANVKEVDAVLAQLKDDKSRGAEQVQERVSKQKQQLELLDKEFELVAAKLRRQGELTRMLETQYSEVRSYQMFVLCTRISPFQIDYWYMERQMLTRRMQSKQAEPIVDRLDLMQKIPILDRELRHRPTVVEELQKLTKDFATEFPSAQVEL